MENIEKIRMYAINYNFMRVISKKKEEEEEEECGGCKFKKKI